MTKTWQLFGFAAAGTIGFLFGAMLQTFDFSEPICIIGGFALGLPILFFIISLSVPTCRYIRRELKTQVSYSDAKQLSPIFSSVAANRWRPHYEVLSLPPEQRRDYLFSVLKQWPYGTNFVVSPSPNS